MVHTMVSRLLIILAGITLGAASVVAQSSKVTVHRGSDTHTIELDSQGYALAPKVRIERVPQVPAETATQANTRMQVIGVYGLVPEPVAGQTLWLTDESGSRLIACKLVWTPTWRVARRLGYRVAGRYEPWVIRCYTEGGEMTRAGVP